MMHEEPDPLSFEIKIKGCPYRDHHDMKIFLMASSIYSELFDIDQAIRNRLKYTPNLGEDEQRFLEELRRNMEVLHLIE